jgi:predicted nucleotidyltransferase
MQDLSRDEIVKIIIDTLKPLGVLRISIFGSFARQNDSPTSDIDILVRLPSIKSRKLIGLRWFGIDQEIQSKTGRSVDLVSEDSLFQPLRAIIEKDLVVIYEKAG